MNKLFYTNNSDKWENGLPVGNGRLAAMIWDTDDSDILSLNHEQLWTDYYKNRSCSNSAGYLPVVREYLKESKFFEAAAAANLFFGGAGGGISGINRRVDSFQPAGNLVFKYKDKNTLKRRELNIETGVADIVRANTSCSFFADCNNGIICCRWIGNNLCGKLFFEREYDNRAVCSYKIDNSSIVFYCKISEGMLYKTIISYSTDGKFVCENDGISVTSATFLTAFVNIVIDEIEQENINNHCSLFDEYLSAHSEKFSSLMNRNCLKLCYDKSSDSIPTDIRIADLRSGKTDNGLLNIYFDYGRYLLLSSCVCGNLPANLQGKWNIDLNPPWQSDYHTNINLQMNYWMTEALGMEECSKVLFKYIKDMMPSAKEAAARLYGCRGVWFPLQGDCWHKATPESYGYAVWIGAAPWLAQHLWRHYIYTNDIEFLKNDAYPFFKEVAEFYEDYLVKDDNGVFQIMPSQSPENKFEGTGHFPVSICISSAMDIELANDALFYAISSAEILETDTEKIQIWKSLRKNLPELSIGSDGRLLEWGNEAYKEAEPGHRHLSHLYGLYPSDSINQYDTPELYNAALESLNYRISAGGGHTGWSRAWTACFYGKIGKSELFLEHYEKLITDFATDSLLDLHPPRIFQIDGNLGAVAAIIEALLSVSGGKVRLLNALPDSWPSGNLSGVYVPGGHNISFAWKDGKISELNIEFGFENEILFTINGQDIKVKKADKKALTLNF